MEYIVKLTYMDDKQQEITIPGERLGEFAAALSKSEIFWLEAKNIGFWTDMKNVRHVLFRIVEEPIAKIKTEPKPKKNVKPPQLSRELRRVK